MNFKEDFIFMLIAFAFIAAVFFFFPPHVKAQTNQAYNWEYNPNNWANNANNFNNTAMDYNNSPFNYQNSPMNYNSTNGVYDNRGNRIGYEVQSSQGTVNYFDNNGNRIGYSR
jgi:hypothetical protein